MKQKLGENRKAAWMEGGKWGEEAVAVAKAGSGTQGAGSSRQESARVQVVVKKTNKTG